MTDPNRNRTEVAFDASGMVVGTAVMGKARRRVLGDSLEDFEPDLTARRHLDLLSRSARPAPHAMLGKAHHALVYDLDRYHARSGQPAPVAALPLARETHDADPGGAQTKIQISFSYSDGFGREIQKKIQAERGDASQRGPDVTCPAAKCIPARWCATPTASRASRYAQRWVGSGWTVFNNKGKPGPPIRAVLQPTPIAITSSTMTDIGVSPILFYDPVERVVATLHPNHTWEKVVFDPWQQTT